MNKPPRAPDMTGQRFSKLTVLRRVFLKSPSVKARAYWECQCDCGALTIARGDGLRDGTTRSCGCLQREIVTRLSTKHGKHRTPEYRVWSAIISRCYDPARHNFARYGGRGIRMSPEWRQSFEVFLRDVGPRPTPQHTIERQDTNGHYEAGNVVWATQREQANNRRNNRRIEWNGITKTVADWARHTGIPEELLRTRIKRHWPVDRLFNPEHGVSGRKPRN